MQAQSGAVAPTAGVTDQFGARSEPDGYVMLRLGGARYAVGMSAVAEVGRLPGMTRVPGTPLWLAGVANWRGRILAVIDIRPLLDAPITPTGSLGRLVVLSEDGVTVGLLTEGVHGVVSCDAGDIERPPVTLDTDAAALVLGQFADRSGPIALLDPGALVSLRLRLPTPRRAAS
jgi:purine-binding chemotaxis protein CheW